MIEPLPIDPLLPHVVSVVRAHASLVLTAPPGAGKTTRVPRALHEAGLAGAGEIVVLEPRRIAARLAAARVAAELEERLGESVGYTIRYERVGGPRTRIRFITEAVLTRRLVGDPALSGVAVVVLDEFHERNLHTDMALALVRRLQRKDRPDLKLLVMSATIDPDPAARFLGGAPVLRGTGAPYRAAIEFAERATDRPLHLETALAVRRALRAPMEGDILVFLPGAAEIRQTAAALETIAGEQGLLVVPLHGDLAFRDQLRAVAPASRRKVILATNVAESSVTIPGVGIVIDSGLAREAGYSAWSGLPRLSLSRISKASADQRAGRAGRTREGHVLRLYTRHDFDTRPDFDRPEIQRLDLSELVLALHGLGIRDSREVEWLDAPPESALEAAESLLERLGAVDSAGRLSATGSEMLRVPVHPRLSRMILEGRRLGAGRESCLAAALMSERDIRVASRAFGRAKVRATRGGADSDLAELIELFEKAHRGGFESEAAARLDLDSRALESVDRHYRHLERALPTRSARGTPAEDREEALRIALLAGFPDRVARLKKKGAPELLLSSGGTALLSDSSVVRDSPLLVALDVEEKTGRKGSLDSESVIVRLASAIEAEWLAALFPEQIAEEREFVWDEAAGRVDEIVRVNYGRLVLEEGRYPAPATVAVCAILAEAALRRDLRDFPDAEAFSALRLRLDLIGRHFPGLGAAEVRTDARSAVTAACTGCRSLAELKRSSLVEAALAPLAAEMRRLLEREAPERIALPGGRKLKVHYESDGPPWVESRLQDFFGMKRTPAICAGRQPLTVRLLAPNMRPVQMTQDLASFWKNHYPALRRQLQRRYPNHSWPEAGDSHRCPRGHR